MSTHDSSVVVFGRGVTCLRPMTETVLRPKVSPTGRNDRFGQPGRAIAPLGQYVDYPNWGLLPFASASLSSGCRSGNLGLVNYPLCQQFWTVDCNSSGALT